MSSKGLDVKDILECYNQTYEKMCSKQLYPCEIIGDKGYGTNSCNLSCNLLKTKALDKIFELVDIGKPNGIYKSCKRSDKYIKDSYYTVNSFSLWLEKPNIIFLFIAYIIENNECGDGQCFETLINAFGYFRYNTTNFITKDIYNAINNIMSDARITNESNSQIEEYLDEIFGGLYEYYDNDLEKVRDIKRSFLELLEKTDIRNSVNDYDTI